MTDAQGSTDEAQQQRVLEPHPEKDGRRAADIRIKSSAMKRDSALGGCNF